MASSLLCPLSASAAPVINDSLAARQLGSSNSSFLLGTKLLSCVPRSVAHGKRSLARRCFKSPVAQSFDHIPKQFRQDNLKDGLMDNYKNTPKYLYGLTPSQLEMFMTEDNHVYRQAERVTEESISSFKSYSDNTGVWSMSSIKAKGRPKCHVSASGYGGGARGYGRPRTAPPDLPSLLLDARIVYLGMPIVPAVTELIVAEFMWLDYEDSSKPIYLYINSPGTQDENRQIVGSETDAYAIADMMNYVKSKVYTVNFGMAYGQAAMLLSLGAKGYRAVQPNSSTKLYLPKISRSSGASTDMWIRAKELDVNAAYYIELLAKGIGKSEEEIANDIQRPRFFLAEDAVDYGIVDKIIEPEDDAFEKRNYDEMLAQSKAMRRQGGGAQVGPSGFR